MTADDPDTIRMCDTDAMTPDGIEHKEDDGRDIPRGMTLEGLVTMTGEMEHLNELVLLHVEKAGGFSCTASYLSIVTPVLDMLEGEIRFRYREGMDHAEIKSIIADWIDHEIAGFRPEKN